MHPDSVRVSRARHVFDPAAADADEDEHVQPAQQDRVDGEEVTGEHRRSGLAQERAPVELATLRYRRDARCSEEVPPERGGDVDPELAQLTSRHAPLEVPAPACLCQRSPTKGVARGQDLRVLISCVYLLFRHLLGLVMLRCRSDAALGMRALSRTRPPSTACRSSTCTAATNDSSSSTVIDPRQITRAVDGCPESPNALAAVGRLAVRLTVSAPTLAAPQAQVICHTRHESP